MSYTIKIKEYSPTKTAAVRVKTTLDKVPEKVSQLLNETYEYLEGQGIEPTGPGFGIYYEVGSFLVDIEVGYPVDAEVEGNERVKPGELQGCKAAMTVFKGKHIDVPEAHRAVHEWMHDNEVKSTGDPTIERFITDLRTHPLDEPCEVESVWPVEIETRAERRRKSKEKQPATPPIPQPPTH